MVKDGRLVASGSMEEVVEQGRTLESIFMEVVNDAGTD
jgi:ABC-2 type transport system ATP-binding protein